MCWGCGKCVGVWESMGWCGNGGRCVEVCLGCGEMCLGCDERCGKGVGVGAMWGVGGNVGRNMGQSGRAGKCGEKGSVTILAPNSPYPNPPDHNSLDP